MCLFQPLTGVDSWIPQKGLDLFNCRTLQDSPVWFYYA
jgi:hypothetical protein